MKKNILLIAMFSVIGFSASQSLASENEKSNAIKNSTMIKEILNSFKKHQGLNCTLVTEESGEASILFFEKSYRSFYTANYICIDGRVLQITGVIGDGGQTTVEKIRCLTAAN